MSTSEFEKKADELFDNKKPAERYGLKLMMPSAPEHEEDPQAVKEAIRILEESRDLVESRWVRGGWASKTQEQERGEDKQFDQTHYCVMGAMLHVKGCKDDDIDEDEAKDMFQENPFLLRSMEHAFRNHLEDAPLQEEKFDPSDYDDAPEEPEKPEPPVEPTYPARPSNADSDDEVDLKHKIDVENYRDEVEVYKSDLEAYEEELKRYQTELKEFEEEKKEELRTEHVGDLVETIIDFNDDAKTFRGKVKDKFTSAISYLKKLL